MLCGVPIQFYIYLLYIFDPNARYKSFAEPSVVQGNILASVLPPFDAGTFQSSPSCLIQESATVAAILVMSRSAKAIFVTQVLMVVGYCAALATFPEYWWTCTLLFGVPFSYIAIQQTLGCCNKVFVVNRVLLELLLLLAHGISMNKSNNQGCMENCHHKMNYHLPQFGVASYCALLYSKIGVLLFRLSRIYIDHDVMHGATFPVYDFQKFLTHPFADSRLILRLVKDPLQRCLPGTRWIIPPFYCSTCS